MKTLKTSYESNLQQPYTFQGIQAINIFGLVFVRKGAKFTEVDYNHEHIHSKQMAEMLWVFFYLWYGIEYLIILVLLNGTSRMKGIMM